MKELSRYARTRRDRAFLEAIEPRVLLSALPNPSELFLRVEGGAWFGTVEKPVPAFRVELYNSMTNEVVDDNSMVTINGEFLVRPQTVQAKHGVAVFDDLAFSTAGDDNFLIDWGGAVQDGGWLMYIRPEPTPALKDYGLRKLYDPNFPATSLALDNSDNLVVGGGWGVESIPLFDGDYWDSWYPEHYRQGDLGKYLQTDHLAVDAQGNVFSIANHWYGYGIDFSVGLFVTTSIDHGVNMIQVDNNGYGGVMQDVVCDRAGNVFVAMGPDLLKYSAEMQNLQPYATLPSDTWGVNDLAVDDRGNLYFADDNYVGEIAAGTTQVRVLHRFTNEEGAGTGIGGLVIDSAGNVFGFTKNGGPDGWGTVFEIPAGTTGLRTLHTFDISDDQNHANTPVALTIDRSGDLIGTTSADTMGSGLVGEPVFRDGGGVVFELDPFTGAYTEYPLTSAGFANPIGELVTDRNGNIYGIAAGGRDDASWELYTPGIFELIPNHPLSARGIGASAFVRSENSAIYDSQLESETPEAASSGESLHPFVLNVGGGQQIALPDLLAGGVHIGDTSPVVAPSENADDVAPDTEGEGAKPATTQPAKSEKSEEVQKRVGATDAPQPELLATAIGQHAIEPVDLVLPMQQTGVRTETAPANPDEVTAQIARVDSSIAAIFVGGTLVGENERRRRGQIYPAHKN